MSYICDMEKKQTPAQQRRSERNAKIKEKVNEEIKNGWAKSVAVYKAARRFNLTMVTIYNVLKEGK